MVLVILEGPQGQTAAIDALDVRAVFPAVTKGDDKPGAIPLLGFSVVQCASAQHPIVAKGSVEEIAQKVNAARREVLTLTAGKDAPDPNGVSYRKPLLG